MNSLDKGRVPNSSEAMKAFSLAGRVALISVELAVDDGFTAI